jgi:hypothetical protein
MKPRSIVGRHRICESAVTIKENGCVILKPPVSRWALVLRSVHEIHFGAEAIRPSEVFKYFCRQEPPKTAYSDPNDCMDQQIEELPAFSS